MRLVVHPHRHDGWTVLALAGDLDVTGAPELRGAVLREINAGHRHLVLDLSGVDFVDSFGLGAVVGALKRVRQRDGSLELVVPEPRVRRVFELVDLDRVLVLHRSLGEIGAPA